jgi:hypothetical protein
MKTMSKILMVSTFVFISANIFSQKFTPVAEIPEGKALVYIYRPGSMVGAAVHYTVNANDTIASKAHLRNKSYIVFFAEPGRYTFWAQVTNTRRAIDIDVEAGKTYYIKGDCCEFTIPDPAKAEKEIIGCNVAKE